jgi:5-methylcytosine-specific restriction endonuclease McrA
MGTKGFDKFSDYQRSWRAANADRLREYGKQYRADNVDKVRQKNKAYNISARDKITQRMRDWRKENPDRAKLNGRLSSAAYRAKMKGVPIRFSGPELRDRYEEQCGLCAYCLVPLNGEFHAEHVIPLATGGSNGIENIVCACAACNRSKWKKPLLSFIQILTRRAA